VVKRTEIEAVETCRRGERGAVPSLLLVSQLFGLTALLGREDSDGGGEVGGGLEVKRMVGVAVTVLVL
jgi:hypothetical protein